MKIGVIGRGFAGLSSAIQLREVGYNVVLLGPKSNSSTASTAAHGASTIKGLHEASQELFSLKLAGHREFPAWQRKIELLSGRNIPTIEGVWERFSNHQEFKAEQHRIYKRRFLGAFSMNCGMPSQTGFSSFDNEHSCWFKNFYPQDFWIETDEYLLALEESCVALKIPVLTLECVTKLIELDDRVTVCCGVERYDFDAVVVASGAGVANCLKNVDGASILRLFAAPGYTGRMLLREKNGRDFCAVKELSAEARNAGRMYLGSTTEANGIPLSDAIFEDKPVLGGDRKNNAADEMSKIYSRVLGLDPVAEDMVETNWGVRVRSRDRLPVVGGLTDKQRIFINTGYYKSGITLTPLGANLLVALMSKKTVNQVFQPMNVSRFKISR